MSDPHQPPSPGPLSSPPVRFRTAVLGVVLTVTVLLTGGALGYGNIRHLDEGNRRVRASRELIVGIEILLSTVKEGETAQRGFLLTSDTAYLVPFRSALAAVPAQFTRLGQIAENDPVQRPRLDSLHGVIDRKFVELSRTVSLAEQGDHAAALDVVRSGVGRQLMDSARAIGALIDSYEQERRRVLAADADATTKVIGWSIVLTTAVGAMLVTLVLVLSRRSLTEQQRVAAVLTEQRERLRALTTELRQTATDLSEANHRKDEFLATLAHELRNPLAPVRNGLRIMRLSGVGSGAAPVVDEALMMIERQVAQLVRLVDDLLDASRISRGKESLRIERIDLATVLRNAVETSRPIVDIGGHTVTLTLPPGPLFVDADITRLEQVFTNLLNNAAKFSDRGGRIAVHVAVKESTAVVSVRDDGIGIPPAMLEHIFDLFAQVDRSLEKSRHGLGIGLTLVKRLVEMHGGTVEAHSDGEGKGSEFVVRLPLAAAPTNARPEPARVAELRAIGRPRLRVLVADDNADSAATLGMLLELNGHDVHSASDGVEAVEAAARLHPHVILLDIGMPRLNGHDACRQIRAAGGEVRPVIIALTGWGQDDDRRRSADAGFDHHLVKPIDPMALERMLAALPGR